jgi:hemoglobin/transferrin/lactoferrin receptor protein
MLERVEILSGPASTLYGSDALGGVVMLQTKNPKISPFEKRLKLNTANALVRYASANHEKTVSTGFGFGNRKWGLLTNISFSDFDDLRQGAWDPNNQLDTWGRRYYVDRVGGIGGKDSVFKSSDELVQKFSGYRQFNLMQKILFAPDMNNKHALNLQYSTSSDIPRYDRLTEVSNGIPKHAEWYYGPQERRLLGYQYDYFGDKKLFDDFRFNANYQGIQESRNTRKFQEDEIQKRVEKIHVMGLSLAARKNIKQHEITYGADGQFNILNSRATEENIRTGYTIPTDTRYPDGDNSMNLYGVYVQHLYKFGKGKFVLNDGIRLNATTLNSTIENNLLNLPFSEINENNQALTGNIGLIYFPVKKVRLNLNAARGFRSPNIDDLGKVFDSFSGEMIVVPNQDLKPEYTNSVDLGIQYQDDHHLLNLYGFYTDFNNAIVLDEFQFNGSDSLLYNNVMTKVFANQNKADAYLYGAGFETKIDFTDEVSFAGNVAYTFGRFAQANSAEVPLDHVPPLYGRASLSYSKELFNLEFYCLFNGAKKLKDYNPNGEDNLKFALANGTPSWYTLNLRSNFKLDNKFNLQFGIDNILDRNYRHFASGISSSGRSLIMSLRYQY